MSDEMKVFLSAPQEPDKRITALRAALAAWGVDAFYEQRGKDAEMQLSQRVQQAIVDCTIFLRVCTEATPRSFWMSLEAGTFLGVQSDDHRQGSPQRRKQANLILSYDYVQEPFDRAGILIDATTRTTIEWVNALRDVLGLAPLSSVDGLNLDLPPRRRTLPRRTLIATGLAAGVLVLGGATADVIVNRLNRGPIVIALPTVTPTKPPRAVKKWAFATGASVSATVAVADGVVYAGSWDGNLYALDAATGVKRWSFAAGGSAQFQILKPPTVASGLVYVQATNPTDVLRCASAVCAADGGRLEGLESFPGSGGRYLRASARGKRRALRPVV